MRVWQLLKMRECEQVAAVCYRLRRGVAIEFLLVQTRGSGRWTFPKGSAEPGLTHAQAAAIEAFEEAGVHGRMEEVAFMRYACRKPCDPRSERSNGTFAVSAHLCEVRRLCAPKEANRNRTWFSAKDAKDRLREGRKNGDGEELARVVQRAVARIQRLQGGLHVPTPAAGPEAVPDKTLQRVQFEAFAPLHGGFAQASLTANPRRRLAGTFPVENRSRETMQGEVLHFDSSGPFHQTPRLLPGSKKIKALGTGSRNG